MICPVMSRPIATSYNDRCPNVITEEFSEVECREDKCAWWGEICVNAKAGKAGWLKGCAVAMTGVERFCRNHKPKTDMDVLVNDIGKAIDNAAETLDSGEGIKLDKKDDHLLKLLRTIRSETRPIEGHTDPKAIQDCWSEVEQIINNKFMP